MAKMFITMAYILTACAACKGDETTLAPSTSSAPAQPITPIASTYPDPAPEGIWDPNKPQPYPLYDLPAGWKKNSDNPDQAIYVEVNGRGIMIDMGVEPQPEDGTTAKQWRDKRYNYLSQDYCLEMGGNGIGMNCDKGFKKEVLNLGGRQVYAFHYYGTLGDLDLPMTELFWKGDNVWLESLTVEGDFQKVKPGLIQLIRTLHYEDRVPSDSFKK